MNGREPLLIVVNKKNTVIIKFASNRGDQQEPIKPKIYKMFNSSRSVQLLIAISTRSICVNKQIAHNTNNSNSLMNRCV